RDAGAAQSRHLHPADLVHRAARGGGADSARTAAHRRPDHRGALAGGRGAAYSLYARTGRRRGRAHTFTLKDFGRTHMDIDLPEVVAEVRRDFERYEQALVTDDVATLDGLFRDDPRPIRYGGGEILYGYDEIK